MSERTGRMQRIGEVMDFPRRLEEISEARQRYRAEQIARHDWPDTVICPGCGDAGRDPETGAPCGCERGRRMEEHDRRDRDWGARCPRRFRDFTLDSHPNREAVAKVTGWLDVDVFRGANLVLVGSVGTGKTGLAIGALRELHRWGRTVRYGTVPDILDAMRPNPTQEQSDLGMREIQRVQVLLMDDLGTEKASEWQAERIYMAINGRYERELPTIVTTNRTMPELRDLVGERTMSRLTDDAVLVAVRGRDLRRAS